MLHFMYFHVQFNMKSSSALIFWLDVYGWSWFEASNQCRSKGETIAATSNFSKSVWTKYYNRRSHWMAILGNYISYLIWYFF